MSIYQREVFEYQMENEIYRFTEPTAKQSSKIYSKFAPILLKINDETLKSDPVKAIKLEKQMLSFCLGLIRPKFTLKNLFKMYKYSYGYVMSNFSNRQIVDFVNFILKCLKLDNKTEKDVKKKA